MTKKLKSLLLKSAFIQKEIEKEASFKHKNWLKILRLKKLRLKIKDKIQSLTDMRAQRKANLPILLPAYALVKIDNNKRP